MNALRRAADSFLGLSSNPVNEGEEGVEDGAEGVDVGMGTKLSGRGSGRDGVGESNMMDVDD
jgi:hypothetical protein